jgi:hypothetical protein
MFLTISGCILAEKTETHVYYDDNNAPPQITTIWHNISSTAENEQQLKDDFDELVGDLKDSTVSDILAGIDKEMLIKERQISLQNGELQLKMSAVPVNDQFEDLAANGERMLILEKSSEWSIEETNGKLLETEYNYIIVWPEKAKELYWIQGLISDASNEDSDMRRWKQNRPKLIQMFEAYQQKGN